MYKLQKNNNVHVYKALMIVSTYTSLLLRSLLAPHTMPTIYEQHSPCHHTTEEHTYCSGTIYNNGVSVCRAAAVLSASAQVTDTVYTGLRGINVTPWKVESVKIFYCKIAIHKSHYFNRNDVSNVAHIRFLTLYI